MGHFIIFANGDISNTQVSLPAEATVIAADGGAQHCLSLGIGPNVVIGDFDSLTTSEILALEAQGTELIRYPAEKDETDLELALDHAYEKGATEVTLYGLLGGRWDMSFANLLLLAAPRFAGIHFQVLSGMTQAFILRSGETLELQGRSGDTVSVIPLSAGVSGLTYEGLLWPLEKASLTFGSPRGVSNKLLNAASRISLQEGIVLVFLLQSID